MKSHCVVLRILVCAAVFCAAGSLSCRRKTPEPTKEPTKVPTEVNKPQPGPGEVSPPSPSRRVQPEPNVPVETGPNSVAVTVNGANITEGEVDKLINMQLAGTPNRSPEVIEQYKKILRQQALEGLIVGRLLDEKVKDTNIVVTDEEVTSRLKEIASLQKPAMSLEDFKKKMEEYGQNFDEVKGQVRKGLSYQKLIEAQPGGKISVTEQDANNFYTENIKHFETPEQVRASHILIKPDTSDPNADPNQAKAKALTKIKGLLEQIKAGADFAQLARDNSACPSATRGGDLDFFPRGQMEPSFEKAAFAMDVNQVSDIVETSYGYHIIKVTDRKPAVVTPFEQVKDQIINQLKQRKLSEVARQYVQSLRAGAKIVYPPGKEPKPDRPVSPTPPDKSGRVE
jgi:peptidyl-prolyl cis-trans isomerase C